MNINLEEVLKDRKGKEITNGDSSATMRDALYMTIDMMSADEKMGPDLKLKLAKLGHKLAAASEEIELSAGEITTLVERSAIVNSVHVHGLIVLALDPKAFE